ncbi:junctional adhesion molecule 2A-like isoform X1 [Salvelinus fontinalis]|uniref:junctional adhesion molecule 2A-like isoform X1 n=1 Tax=Salvelinus fontinalis TaxID=8038 RepID=UPI002485426E|nr:junctional adhesion molecule 2A-like isoform X1 [Salvelinus fontinalis]
MDSMGMLSLIFLVLLQSPASFSLTVSTSKAKVVVHENTDAVLSCQFKTEKETNPRIEWKKKGKDITFVYFDGKFSGDHYTSLSLFLLASLSSTLFLILLYCTAPPLLRLSYLFPSNTISYYIPPPLILLLFLLSSLYTFSLIFVTLVTCGIQGSFAGRAKIEGATVTLHAVTQKDSGLYRCEVSAPADHTNLGEINVTLNVLVPPHTPSCEVPSSVLSGAGVELHCKDKLSVPPPTYIWYKDNKALSTTHTTDTSFSMDTDKGTLKFKSVSKADSGQYRCEASNSVGAPKSCVAHHMKVMEYQLSMTTLIAGAVGLFLLIVMCCLGVCLCHRRGCCNKKEQKGRSTNSYNPPPPPTRNPKNYKHTQSFMI